MRLRPRGRLPCVFPALVLRAAARTDGGLAFDLDCKTPKQGASREARESKGKETPLCTRKVMDDKVRMSSTSGSSWLAIDGSLEQSVKVVEDSEDAIYTAGPTGKLILARSSEQSVPCELTVTFQQRLGYVHQIYVLSTARICEIYGQKEQNGDLEYVCTVRGGMVPLTEEDFLDNTPEFSAPGTSHVITRTDDPSQQPLPDTSAVANLESDTEAPQQIFSSRDLSEDLVDQGKDSPLCHIRSSDEELFQSFTEAVAGAVVEGSITFEESLDHVDWVECPHSPMKGSAPTSDDEAEVDINKSGFYLVDAESEAQPAGHQQLFCGAIGNSSEYAGNVLFEGGDEESTSHSSWQEADEEAPVLDQCTADIHLPQDLAPVLDQCTADIHLPQDLTSKPDSERDQKRRSDVLEAHLDQSTNEGAGENLTGAGLVASYVDEDLDSKNSRSSSATSDAVTAARDASVHVAKTRVLEGPVDRTLFQAPVYECEVNLFNSDAWISLTIRLLSMKNKSQALIHRVVVTSTPGPPIQPGPLPPTGSFQQGVSSSLLAMLVPGILQMARGLSEPIKSNRLAVSLADGVKGESSGMSPESMAEDSGSLFQQSTVTGEGLPDLHGGSTQSHVCLVKQNSNRSSVEGASFLCNLAQNGSCETRTKEALADGRTNVFTECGQEGASVSMLPKVAPKIEEASNVGQEGVNESKLFEVPKKEDDGLGEVVQRLSRLESICLRMESSLNSALENMDRRLKLLEAGGAGRSAAVGHPLWGSSFESGSFISASSVHLPAIHTGNGINLVRDSQVPVSISSAADLSLREPNAHSVSSRTTPFYPDLFSSTFPSVASSVSAALPLWPLSWPQHPSPESSSHSSGRTASPSSKGGHMTNSESSHDSEQTSNVGEMYWESRSSEELETDISSGSERTSCADNSQDLGCGCCLESLPSSPIKPAQLVDNALASALSAFTASFEITHGDFCEDEVYHGQASEGEDIFESEEQLPLVDLDCISCDGEKSATHANVEEVVIHGYEPIPASGGKDICNPSVGKVIQEDTIWPSDNDKQIDWQDQVVQTQEEVIFIVTEDPVLKSEGSTILEDSTAVPFHPSDALCIDDTAVQVGLPCDLGVLGDGTLRGGGKEPLEAGEDLHQNPFLQKLVSRNGNVSSTWLHGWSEKHVETAQPIPVSYMTVRGFSKPLLSHKEVLLQDDLFPDEWNWFTSEFLSSSFPVELKELSKDSYAEKTSQPETTFFVEESSLKAKPESWSLLDEDVSKPNFPQRNHGDGSGKDWLEQKSHWSLLDSYPPVPPRVDGDSEEGSPEDWLGQREPRSLLDEDTSIPSGNFPAEEQELKFYSSPGSLEDNLSLSGVIKSSKYIETLNSPSSQASRSNPFEDEYDERFELSQGCNNVPLVLLEFGDEEIHEFDATEPERTQSLLFHLSL